jgi:hypothetical protein
MSLSPPSTINHQPSTIPKEHQLEEIARAWHKMKMLGLRPEQRLFDVGHSMGFDEIEINRISNRVRFCLKRIGVPRNDEQLTFPCHRRFEPNQIAA